MPTERDVVIRYISNHQEAVRGAAVVSGALNDAGKATGRASDEARKATKEEHRLAAALREADKAAKDKAQELGITTTQLKRLESQASKTSEVIGHDMNQQLRGSADAAGDVDSILKGLGGSLGTVSDEADKTAGTIGEVFAGLEAVLKVGGAFGPVGAAVAAVVAAGAASFALLSRELETANARIAEMAERSSTMRDIHIQVEQAERALAVATGEMTAAEAARLDAIERAQGVFEPRRQAILAEVEATKEQLAAQDRIQNKLLKLLPIYHIYNKLTGRQVLSEEELSEKLQRLEGDLGRTDDAQRNLTDTIVATNDQQEKNAEATKKAADATREQAAAAKKAADEYKRLDDTLTKAAAAFESAFEADYIAGLDTALFTMDRSTKRSLDSLKGLNEQVDELVPPEALGRVEQLELLLFQLNTEAARGGEQSAALAEGITRVSEALEQAKTEEYIADIQMGIDLTRQFFGVVDDIASAAQDKRLQAIRDIEAQLQDSEKNLSDSQRASLDKELAERKKAATKAFKLQQALKVAEIAMNTAQSVMQAFAMFGPPPSPIGIAAAAAAGAIGIAQAGLVLAQPAPAFDIGGLISAHTPDQVNIRALPGEGVVSRSGMAALGEDGLHRLNRGEAPAGGGGPTVFVYKHRVFNAMVADNLRMPGSPLNTALRGTSLPGHRSRNTL